MVKKKCCVLGCKSRPNASSGNGRCSHHDLGAEDSNDPQADLLRSVVWINDDPDGDGALDMDFEDSGHDVMVLCRFCLRKKPQMHQLEWSKWPTAAISKLYQEVVGEALIVSDKLSEFWCSDCQQGMESAWKDIQRWKDSNMFWRKHWYERVQKSSTMKIEAIEDDTIKDDPMVSIELLDFEDFEGGFESNHESPDSADIVEDAGSIVNDTFRPRKDGATVKVKSDGSTNLEVSGLSVVAPRKIVKPKTIRRKVAKKAVVEVEEPRRANVVEVKMLKCSLCEKSFLGRLLLREHVEEEHDGKKSLACDLCDRSFASKVYLYRHRKFVHFSKELKYKCQEPGCDKIFRRLDSLRNHKLRHGEKKLICDLCSFTFHMKKDMVTHWHFVHLKMKPVICEKCGQGFQNSYTLRKKHPPSVCARPRFSYQSESDSLNGRKFRRPRSTVQTPLHCNSCQRVCHSTYTLEGHYRKEHPEWDMAKELEKICIICYRQFQTAEERTEHHESVHNRWQCPICKMSLKCQESLDRHMTRHPKDKERRFRCEVCGSQHLTLAHMKNHHRRAHTNERPHECDICHKRFAELPEMRTHRKLHTRQPTACTECGQTFANAKLARQHYLQRHTNDYAFFTCEFCPEKFGTATQMNLHARSHHPKELQGEVGAA